MAFDEVVRPGEFAAIAEEASAVQMHVGEVERHRPALGNELSLVEETAGRFRVARQGSGVQRRGEQSQGKNLHVVGPAKLGECGGNFRLETREI